MLQLIFVTSLLLCQAGYTVSDGVIEVCDNPEIEKDLTSHSHSHSHHSAASHSHSHSHSDSANATTYRARTPPPKRTTQLRVPRVHFFHPLEDSLLELNRVIYEKNLFGTNDGAFYYEQPAHEVQMTTHPEIKDIEASYTVNDVTTTTIYTVSHVCENLGDDTDLECSIDQFDLHYSLWRQITDGFTFSTHHTLKPVTLNIQHQNLPPTDLEWTFSQEHTSPTRTQHLWHQPRLTVMVPPQSTYRFIAEIQHETLSGVLKLNARIVSDGLDEFRWKVKTCAANAMDSTRRCKWIEQGFFHSKDVANTLTEADKLKICGSRHPRLCRLRVDHKGNVYAIASALYQVALPPTLKTTVVDTTNHTRVIEEPVVL